MSPEEIIEAYNVVAQDVRNQAANDAAVIGNSQRSLGPLAAAVASPAGQTSGLANYTYNRVMRPTIDTTAASLVTQGKAQAVQKELTDQLLAAKSRYEDAKNAYTVSSSTPKTTTNDKENEKYEEVEDTSYTGEQEKETVENTDKVVTSGDFGKYGYIMLGLPWGGAGAPGEYVFQDSRGNQIRIDLPANHEFVVDPETGNLTTRPKK